MEPEKEVKKIDKEKNKDIVFVGGKNFMNYVNAVEWQLKEFKKVTVRARGKYTSRAIDISQVMINRYGCEIVSVELGSSEFENKENKKVKVSTIDVLIKRGSKWKQQERHIKQ